MRHSTEITGRYAIALCLLVTGLLVSSTVFSQTNLPSGTNQFKVVNGLAIYIGIMPAEILKGHSNKKMMHGGIPTGLVRFHLTVAIFNDKTGKRINNANVTAQIFTIPEKTGYKELELMEFGETMVYGNYFSMKALGPYLIQLNIIHDSLKKPIKVEFQHQAAYANVWKRDNKGNNNDRI
ncbi:MAG: hypothetical protein GXP13_01280 [Gammaproteobacteria bacterium]|nr:hypothetical protein [Gammaproteobacteria bacterium]